MSLNSNIMQMSTKSAGDRVEMISMRSLQLERSNTLSSNENISSSSGLKSQSINDLTVVSMELNNILIIAQFQSFLLDAMLHLVSDMLATFNVDQLSSEASRGGVLNLETEDMLAVDIEVDLSDLLLSTQGNEVSRVREDLSVIVGLSSRENGGLDLFDDDLLLELVADVNIDVLVLVGELVELLLLLLVNRVDMGLEEVQMASESGSQTSKMLAAGSEKFPGLASSASDGDFLSVAGLESEGVHVIAASSVGLDDKLSIIQLNGGSLDVLGLVADMLASVDFDPLASEAGDDVGDFESEDDLLVVENVDGMDFVMAVGGSEELFVRNFDGVVVGGTGEQGLGGDDLGSGELAEAEVDTVEVSSGAGGQVVEVVALLGLELEDVSAVSSLDDFSALRGLEANGVEKVTVTTDDNGEELVRFEGEGLGVDVVGLVADEFVAFDNDGLVGLVDGVFELETEDDFVVVENVDLGDLVGTRELLEDVGV